MSGSSLPMPQVQLFDQPHDLVAADDQAAPGGALFGSGCGACSTAVRKSAWLSRSRCLSVARFGASRLSVRFFSAVLVTEISIVRSSRSSPLLDLFQQLDGRLAARSRWPAACGGSGCGSLRCAWPRRFRRSAIEHRDLAHLHEVHADRVVDVRFAAAAVGIEIDLRRRLRRRRSTSSGSTKSSTSATWPTT